MVVVGRQDWDEVELAEVTEFATSITVTRHVVTRPQPLSDAFAVVHSLLLYTLESEAPWTR